MGALTLPGGLMFHSRVLRRVRLRPITGRIERRVAQLLSGERSPACISAVMACTASSIDGVALTAERAAALCVADRQWFMLQLGIALSGDQVWLSCKCASCGGEFDVGYTRSAVPVSSSASPYPFAEAVIAAGAFRMRVPTGGDQQAIWDASDPDALERVLLRRCVLEVRRGDEPIDPDLVLAELSEADLDELDARLDAVAPSVATHISTACLECGGAQRVPIDPYDVWSHGTFSRGSALDEEVHILACNYHWSEREILSLTLPLRRRYLALIDRQRGMAS